MKKEIRFQFKNDLKRVRKYYKLSPDIVAAKIGYGVRTLNRIEACNRTVDEETAKKLCDLYHLSYEDVVKMVDFHEEQWIKKNISDFGKKPKNKLYPDTVYYLIYVKKKSIFKDCIVGKSLWLRNADNDKKGKKGIEIRQLRTINAPAFLQEKPYTTIIDNKDEWHYWYYSLCIGRFYPVIVSEECMKSCLPTCLYPHKVLCSSLSYFEGETDIMFLGVKGSYCLPKK